MLIADLSISNFRGVRSGRLTFGSFTVLVGANNCGKTTVVEALALLLGRDRLVRTLTEHDFFGSTPLAQDRIHIVGTITDFPSNDPTELDDWFRFGRGVVKWLDAVTGAVKPLQTAPTDKLACQIAYTARFDRDSLEVEGTRYFYDDTSTVDPFNESASVTLVPIQLIRELGFFLVPAHRTWDRTISFASDLFRKVVSYVGGKPAEAVLEERDRLRTPPSPLEADAKLAPLVAKVEADIATLLGRRSRLNLRVTTTDSEGVLEAVIPHFSEGDDVPVPSRRQGSGLLSLQTLILLMRFGHLRAEKGDSFLMAIEEPELHVPPPLQRRLLHLMQSLATQTIVTTHSPAVAAVPGPHQVILVVNQAGTLTANALLTTPLQPAASNLERGLFLSDREATVSAIMHRHVLIPEGKTDARWLRLLSRVLDMQSVEGDGVDAVAFTHEIGVIPTKDARMAEVFGHLAKVHPSVTCLVDGDDAGNRYIASLCAVVPPPMRIVRWPDGWAIEHFVAWIVAADAAILGDDELRAAGLPGAADQLAAILLGVLKTDEVTHTLLVEAVAGNRSCRARVKHSLKVLREIVAGSAPPAEWATSAPHANGVTTIWTFNNAVPGV